MGQWNLRCMICPCCGCLILKPRYLRIIELAAQGLTQKEIAERLNTTPATINTTCYKLYIVLKLENKNMRGLLNWYYNVYLIKNKEKRNDRAAQEL